MPLIFSNLNALMNPNFIEPDASIGCTAVSLTPEYIYYTSNNNAPITVGVAGVITVPAATTVGTTINQLSLCQFSKSLAQDVYNSAYTTIVGQVNTSLTNIAVALNQTLDVLRCLGYEECVLTGPSACCVTAGQPAPSKITIPLPRNLNGANIAYTTYGVNEGGTNPSGNFIISGSPKFVK